MKKVEICKGFKKPTKKRIWIFKLEKNYSTKTKFKNYNFSSEWLTINKKGIITVKKKYAWNGCTPKFNFLDLAAIGTPDGIINIETMKPKTYYASLIHDVLYQYYGYHGINRKNIDLLFLEIMRENKFMLALIYFCAVRVFGGIGFFFRFRKMITIDNRNFYYDYYANNIKKNSRKNNGA